MTRLTPALHACRGSGESDPTMTSQPQFPLLESSYSQLPERFARPAKPTPVKSPAVVLWNSELAKSLGLTADPGSLVPLLAGNQTLPGFTPLATAYAGHQFGHFVPQLGDGRAILLGELANSQGERYEIQLKGSGRTPFSRSGDGRSSLGPAIREYLASEAMHALGIPSTRALAVTLTGEAVYREGALPGAVFTRVARSHIRVGTFQYFAARGDVAGVKTLADHVISHFFPALVESDQPYRGLLLAVRDAQAELIARWMQVGFIHGVMNTDNMSILGDTIDYGPCAFMDAYDPATVYSAIDERGRYAYANQPAIAAWNLARLAEAMLSLFDADQARAVERANQSIAAFETRFLAHLHAGMRAKLGLATQEPDDVALANDLLTWMLEARADYTDTFRRLSATDQGASLPVANAAFAAWRARWLSRLARQPHSAAEVTTLMQRHNPAVIARNHKVEEALAAAEQGDLAPLDRLLAALSAPFDHARASDEFTSAPAPGGPAYRTFCGT